MQAETAAESRKSWKIRRKEQLRDDMISAAKALFDEKGFDSTSVDEIVARTGIAKGTFYLYFKTKTDLAKTIVEESIASLENCMSAAMENASGNASIELKSVLEAQLGFFSKNRPLIPMLLTGAAGSSSYLSPQVKEECESACTGVFERIIRKGMLQGIYREIDAPMAARMLRGMVASSLQSSDIEIEKLGAMCMEFFEKGVGRAV